MIDDPQAYEKLRAALDATGDWMSADMSSACLAIAALLHKRFSDPATSFESWMMRCREMWVDP